MMTSKSSFRMPNRPRISLFVSVLAIVLVGTSSRVRADNAPDWLRAAAQQKLVDDPKDAVAIVLLDEQLTVVKDNGEIETTHRYAYKILRPEAREEYGYAVVPFDNETKVSFFRAWTILPNGGQIEVKEKEAGETSLASFEVFSDQRAKFIRFPEANVGSVVGYEYTQRHRPFVFEDDWRFQDKIPTRRARFSLQLPSGWEFTDYWANFPKQKPQPSTNNLYIWEIENIPAIE